MVYVVVGRGDKSEKKKKYMEQIESMRFVILSLFKYLLLRSDINIKKLEFVMLRL